MLNYHINFGLVTRQSLYGKSNCLNMSFLKNRFLSSGNVCHLVVVTFANIKYLLSLLYSGLGRNISIWRKKMQKENKCSTPHCRGEPCLNLMGRDLCEKCWEKHCEECV